MSTQDQKRRLESALESCRVVVPRPGRMVVSMPRDGLTSALLLLKATGFEHLSLISCVDWIEQGELELVYHLWSYRERIHAMVKTHIDRDQPCFVSITPVFPNAQTYERELHEMFGVDFPGNARLIPLLLDHWQATPPMRKDFELRQYARETFGVEERAS